GCRIGRSSEAKGCNGGNARHSGPWRGGSAGGVLFADSRKELRMLNAAAPHVANLAQVIQLAVAPVFLLAGVGTTLNVLATRVGSIIDRARLMEDGLPHSSPEQLEELHERLRVLSKRATLINRAIGLSVMSGLLVSLVVATLFISYSLSIDLAT